MPWRGPGLSPSTRSLHRLWLRRAAHRYAAHDWPVVPGACLHAGRFRCNEPGCPTVECHPAVADWEHVATHDPGSITDWWRRLDHGVLLATGHTFDVLELASPTGRLVARKVDGPVAIAPPGRWMFLIRPGDRLRRGLAGHAGVVLHRAGSWIPAPPTRLPGGRVRWVVPPGRHDWRVPDPVEVQTRVQVALEFDKQPRQVWRQLNRAT